MAFEIGGAAAEHGVDVKPAEHGQIAAQAGDEHADFQRIAGGEQKRLEHVYAFSVDLRLDCAARQRDERIIFRTEGRPGQRVFKPGHVRALAIAAEQIGQRQRVFVACAALRIALRLMAALAYLLRNIDILHTEEMEAEVMRAASRSGLIDMTGSLLPGIDGFNLKMNVSILSLMRQCTDYALRYSHRSDRWFGPVLEKHFFE